MDEYTALRRKPDATRQSLFSSRPCMTQYSLEKTDLFFQKKTRCARVFFGPIAERTLKFGEGRVKVLCRSIGKFEVIADVFQGLFFRVRYALPITG